MWKRRRSDELEAVNLLEMSPVRLADWTEKSGHVVLSRPKTSRAGLMGLIDHMLYLLSARRIRLDAFGSFAWLQLDGKRSVGQVVGLLREEFGADVTINIEEVPDPKERIEMVKKETPGGYGADVVFECAGVPAALPEGIDMLRRGGTYAVVGHFTDVGEVPLNPFTHMCNKHITLVGVWGGNLPYFVKGKPILESGKYPFSKMVSHKLPLERLGDVMTAISTDYRLDGKEVGKVVIASDM